MDGQIDIKDLSRWLRADPFVHAAENLDLFHAVDTCWRELVGQNEAAGFVSPPEEPFSATTTTTCATSTSSSSSAAGPARIGRHFFFLQFSQVPKKLIRKLLVHLLSRNASSVMQDAQQHRLDKKAEHDKEVAAGASSASAAACVAPTPVAGAAPTLPHDFAFPLVRKHSVVIGGSKRISVADGLRISLVGQAMLQHDIRRYPIGADCVRLMRPLLTAHCIFTELETSLVREGREPEKQRNSVFFHAAHPHVLDVLMDMGFNLYSAANNHAGDLGEEGIRTILEEFDARSLCMGGLGLNVRRAALPSFLDTPNGRIAQIAFASKIPEHSIATDLRPGVNSLAMADVDTFTLNPDDLARILAAIAMARTGYEDPDSKQFVPAADMVMVYQHNHFWNPQNSVNSSDAKVGNWKRELAHTLVDAGAHVYVAHGDPRLQG